MGIERLNAVNFDTDEIRMSEYLIALCEVATSRGFVVNIEFMPLLPIFTSLAETVARLSTGKYRGLTIMLDVLHLIRSGGTVADVARAAHLITGAQFSDGPLKAVSEDAYLRAATQERDIPGDGEFPLKDILEAIPAEAVVYLEVPKKSFKDQGLDPTERAQRIIDGMRRVEIAR